MKGSNGSKGNSGNSDHRSPDNIHGKHNMDEAMKHPSGDDNGTRAEFKSGERSDTDGSGDNKQGRQGGGPGEHQSIAGEQGYKSMNNEHTIKKGSHTSSGEVRGEGSLKDGSSNDQDRNNGQNINFSDEIKQAKFGGQNSETGNAAHSGKANHKGGDEDGRGGGKSSGHAGINNPNNE